MTMTAAQKAQVAEGKARAAARWATLTAAEKRAAKALVAGFAPA